MLRCSYRDLTRRYASNSPICARPLDSREGDPLHIRTRVAVGSNFSEAICQLGNQLVHSPRNSDMFFRRISKELQ